MRFEMSPNPSYPIRVIFDGGDESAAVSAAYRAELEEVTMKGNGVGEQHRTIAAWDDTKKPIEMLLSEGLVEIIANRLSKFWDETDAAVRKLSEDTDESTYSDLRVATRYRLGAQAAILAFYLPADFQYAPETIALEKEVSSLLNNS